MNREEIKKILPHREPMLLVDEVELVDGKSHGKCCERLFDLPKGRAAY